MDGRRWLCGSILAAALVAATQQAHANTVIVYDKTDSSVCFLAAREIRRYVYARTDLLLPIVGQTLDDGNAIVVAIDTSLEPQQYRLQTQTQSSRKVLTISGGSDVAVLYGAYDFAEKLGVRFYLHDDVLPDARIPLALPDIDETHRPLFELRGIQPFHDFPEGPDWWNVDDYKAYLSQLAKLRMNFFGLHTYPEGRPHAEPTVWIGIKRDIQSQGHVGYSYPTTYANTMRDGPWGYAPMKTSEFAAGASLLFESDAWGPHVLADRMPRPETPAGMNEVFDRTAEMLRAAFTHGRSLGLKVCVGTETPLVVPQRVQERLRELEMDPADPAVVRQLYEGMFERIKQAYPIDYYWLWTPEGWTWEGVNQDQVDATVRDMQMALEALKNVGSPFGFATCGWVLGPPSDRALFDTMLPKDAALSCINRQVGFTPVEPGFARVEGRPQWAIPWMEDDPALTSPQLWAGRMRRDAADALGYGCTGLMGIHWRTKVLSPNVAALAYAAWDQQGWNPDVGKRLTVAEVKAVEGYVGGSVARFPNNPIEDADQSEVYQSCRYNVDTYRLQVPDGTYRVTLKFCEPHYTQNGKRVFGVKLQNNTVIGRLDVFETVGRNRAIDISFSNVKVTDGRLAVEFIRHVEYPFISGIVVEGLTADEARPFVRKINCGGEKVADYEADLGSAGSSLPFPDKPRDLPVADFYADFCSAQFGPEAADALASLFIRLDGGGSRDGEEHSSHLPRPSDWIGGPGGIRINVTPWEEERARYAFVDEMEAMRPRISGAGNRQRFDYWLDTFRYLRLLGELGCKRGQLDRVVERIKQEPEPSRRKQLVNEEALPLRLELARRWEQMMTRQLATVSTPGELGTVANLEQHVRTQLRFLSAHDEQLTAWLGEPLPAQTQLRGDYMGRARIIVPTTRTLVEPGEQMTLRAIVLDSQPARSVTLHWRPLGEKPFRQLNLHHVARSVYKVTLPETKQDFEYYITARTAEGDALVWPATAPAINRTVVVWQAR